MGLLDRFRRKSISVSPGLTSALNERNVNLWPGLGGSNQRISAAFQRGLDASYGWMYRTQPAVRSVIDFIARNTAQLPLKLYERLDDTERERREDHPAAETMEHPSENVTGDSFIYRLVIDYLIYDNAYALKVRPEGGGEELTLLRLPPDAVTVSGGRFTPEYYTLWSLEGGYFQIPPEDILHWYGYNPRDALLGLSKLETLRLELASDQATQATIVELAKNGLKGGHIERPLDAPPWDEIAANRFREGWRSQKRTREEPVLEEGMKYVQDSITPKDAELLNSRRFTIEEVARQYGVPPGALGIGAGNLAEERKEIYSDVLPPIVKSLACQLDLDILLTEYSEPDLYFEFDLNEKLRGDFETRSAAITQAIGRPWKTVNEGRAIENLPPIEDGDELTIPSNVILAGEQGNPNNPQLPAPNVMPMQDPNGPPQDGSYRETPKKIPVMSGEHRRKALEVTTLPRRQAELGRQRRAIDKATALLDRFYTHQATSMKSKAEKAADSQRWNQALAKELDPLLRTIVELEGGVTVSRLGGHDFDMRQVENYLKAMAEGTAEGINGATQRNIEEMGVSDALTRARNERAAIAGVSIGTRATTFARQEAAKQIGGNRLQTWVADTDRHAELDGVSVSLESDWGGIEPGSEPNCACSVAVD